MAEEKKRKKKEGKLVAFYERRTGGEDDSPAEGRNGVRRAKSFYSRVFVFPRDFLQERRTEGWLEKKERETRAPAF